MSERTVWVVGATGLVGRETVQALLADDTFARVIAFVRRSTGLTHPKLTERVVDFEKLEAAFDEARCDAAVCCLGTTIKVAGSKEKFRRVDHDYPIAFARAALQKGAQQLAIVTALGSDAGSLVFYNQVKGQVEDALSALPYKSLSIARPSLLLGERDEMRLGEKLMTPFSKLLPGKYRGIEGRTVARALLKLLKEQRPGKQVVPSDQLQKLGA